MATVIRRYGAKKRTVVSGCRGGIAGPCSLAESLAAIAPGEERVAAESLSWADVGDPYVLPEDSRGGGPSRAANRKVVAPPAPRGDGPLPGGAAPSGLRSAEDEKVFAANARRRKQFAKGGKQAKHDKQTESLLRILVAWQAWDEQRAAVKDSRPSKTKKVCEATACEKAIACVKSGADCLAYTPCGTNALLLTCSIAKVDAHKVLREMLQAGVELGCAHHFSGRGPVDFAVDHGNTWAVRALLRKGGLPLVAPSGMEGTCSLMELAVLRGFVNEAAQCAIAALWRWVEEGDSCADGVRALLSHGLKPDVRDDMQRTPLSLCVERGHAETAKVLLERGADPNARDGMGTPLAMYALLRQERDAFSALAKHGLRPEEREELSGETVYEAALAHGWAEQELRKLFPTYAGAQQD